MIKRKSQNILIIDNSSNTYNYTYNSNKIDTSIIDDTFSVTLPTAESKLKSGELLGFNYNNEGYILGIATEQHNKVKAITITEKPLIDLTYTKDLLNDQTDIILKYDFNAEVTYDE